MTKFDAVQFRSLVDYITVYSKDDVALPGVSDSCSDPDGDHARTAAMEFASLLDKDAEILDVGCGYGRTLDELYHIDYQHLKELDFSEGIQT